MGYYTPKEYPVLWLAVVKTASHFDAKKGEWIMNAAKRVIESSKGKDYDDVMATIASYKILLGDAEWLYLQKCTGDEATGYYVDSEMLIEGPKRINVAGKVAIAFEVSEGTETGRFRFEEITEGDYMELLYRLPEEADGWHIQGFYDALDEAREYAFAHDLFIVNAELEHA
jgi:hypothetical protein